MSYFITKEYHFYAAHRNHVMTDKCKNMHGHLYRVYVKFKHTKVGEDRCAIPFKKIDGVIDPIILKLDHSTLYGDTDARLVSCIASFPDIFGKIYCVGVSSSIEDLSKHLFELIEKTSIGKFLYSVTIKETESSLVEYIPST